MINRINFLAESNTWNGLFVVAVEAALLFSDPFATMQEAEAWAAAAQKLGFAQVRAYSVGYARNMVAESENPAPYVQGHKMPVAQADDNQDTDQE